MDFFLKNGIVSINWVIIISQLGLTHFSYFNCICQSIILLLYSYYGHIFAHYISDYYPFNYLNPHVSIHHNTIFKLPRWLNLTVESIVTLILFIGIIYIQDFFNVKYFSTSIVFAAALLYICIHILDYSILGNAQHKLHHQKNNCNYEPMFLDILHNTRCDNDSEYIDMNYQHIHLVLSASIVLVVKVLYNFD